MRAIGMAEKALQLMCERVQQRVAFGQPLADQGTIQAEIAESRLAIEQARLLTLKTAWLIDTVGVKGARVEISAIKVAAARLATTVIDRAIQAFGAAGVTNDWPLAEMYGHARTLHFVDGPDEVHLQQIARRELRAYERFRPGAAGTVGS
jgi:acyl-CoA dehydrogenase